MTDSLKIGEVARLAHVSVRTLHHYDEVGLLVPSDRSRAGYRLYSAADVERLQEILFYKELGFTLEDIRELLAQPDLDRREVLDRQRAALVEQVRRLEAMLGLVDKTLKSIEGGTAMAQNEMFEVFGEFNPDDYEDEARDRWGDTDVYREAKRRTSRYTKEDWKRYVAEAREVNASLAALMAAGVPPNDPRATEAAERHRQIIDRWFYPCPHGMHAALGRMYVSDPRFNATYEKVRPGLAQYLCDAIAANTP